MVVTSSRLRCAFRAAIVAVCAATWLLAASDAPAASYAALVGPPTYAGPVFLGDGVGWLSLQQNGAVVVRQADAGGVRIVAVVPKLSQLPALAGSAGLLALAETDSSCPLTDCSSGGEIVHTSAVFAGPIGGPLACVVGFDPRGTCGPPVGCGAAPMVLAADELAAQCGATTAIYDLAPAEPAPTAATLSLYGAVPGGEWAAGVALSTPTGAPDRVELVDWRSGRVAFDLPALQPRVLSVGDDGTVVYLSGAVSQPTVFWASPQAPQPHPVIAVGSASARSAGGLVAIVSGPRDDSRPSPASVTVVDLAGRLVASDAEPAMTGPWDFNGAAVTYFSRPCALTRVVVRDLASAPAARPEGLCPPVTVALRAVLAGRSLTLQVRCEDASGLGCYGETRVQAGSRHASGGEYVLGTGSFSLAPGGRATQTLTLPTRARVWLAAHPRAAVEAIAAGATPPSTTRPPLVRLTRLVISGRTSRLAELRSAVVGP
jgi:hypothetical protein